MSKYIDADKAIKDYFHYGIEHSYDATDLEEILNECPAADVAEVRHGRWITKGQDIFCSVCGEESAHTWCGASKFSNYCPNCGAKMVNEDE